MEAYMWGAAAMFPDESNTIRYGYTPGPMATDEGFNGLTGGGSANVYYGMDFATGNLSPDFFGGGSSSHYNLNQWRSEERRVGKEGASTVRSRWRQKHKKK